MRAMMRGMAAALLLAALAGCWVDQRYVNHDRACAAMPCHKSVWTWSDGGVKE